MAMPTTTKLHESFPIVSLLPLHGLPSRTIIGSFLLSYLVCVLVTSLIYIFQFLVPCTKLRWLATHPVRLGLPDV